ncbi:C3a anaphylatoxin chemotactic receptor-like [Pyxicephalus adspersus]|uniref:G-protein coupled receptors family 1 profile domain-containing protein n=1 Tax=Pyxicephalus adspersus TaxID=30357 RepID=A0AAV2ZNA6_PYXAD|nr:TPA: hypothetical protein GDO54_003308 [Pyxicephalus adspersus]
MYPMVNVTPAGTTYITTYISNSLNGTASPEEETNLVLSIFHKIIIVVQILVFLLGTTGNGLVIFFTSFRMKRTVNVVWYLNLAISDFIFTLFLLFRIVRLALNRWPFGWFMCKLDGAIVNINLHASLFLITVISIDRLICIKFPVWCRNHRTPRLAFIVVLVLWILAFVFSLPHAILKDLDEKNKFVVCKCTKSKILSQRFFIITRLIFGFIFPLIVIVSCYTLILLHIQRNYRTMSRKPLKMIAAVIIVYVICWAPYHVSSLLQLSFKYESKDFKDKVDVGKRFFKSLATVNSCINPVLYVFVGRDFKETFWNSIQSIFEKAFVEESE